MCTDIGIDELLLDKSYNGFYLINNKCSENRDKSHVSCVGNCAVAVSTLNIGRQHFNRASACSHPSTREPVTIPYFVYTI